MSLFGVRRWHVRTPYMPTGCGDSRCSHTCRRPSPVPHTTMSSVTGGVPSSAGGRASNSETSVSPSAELLLGSSPLPSSGLVSSWLPPPSLSLPADRSALSCGASSTVMLGDSLLSGSGGARVGRCCRGFLVGRSTRAGSVAAPDTAPAVAALVRLAGPLMASVRRVDRRIWPAPMREPVRQIYRIRRVATAALRTASLDQMTYPVLYPSGADCDQAPASTYRSADRRQVDRQRIQALDVRCRRPALTHSCRNRTLMCRTALERRQ